ncbi:MAG: FkbM family methyltransferase [Alphaproteobacteria bacterium]|nr:FkbM family methyltransferase [Alphaproteobacteria bacterium]
MNPVRRIKSFRDNVNWLSKLTGSKYRAARYLIKAKRKPGLLGEGVYNQLPLFFRKQDLSALREVLIDREYAFLKPHIATRVPLRILDVGAHIGTFSLWCLATNLAAEIYSVEADPYTFDILKRNRAPAIEQSMTWHCLNRAAWKDESYLSFSIEGDSMSHKLSEKGTINVLGAPLSKLFELSRFQRCDLLKVDIEGAEEVFLSAEPELLEKVEMLVVEIHPKMCNERAIRELLARNFPIIEDVPGRKSSKPLVFCRKVE